MLPGQFNSDNSLIEALPSQVCQVDTWNYVKLSV